MKIGRISMKTTIVALLSFGIILVGCDTTNNQPNAKNSESSENKSEELSESDEGRRDCDNSVGTVGEAGLTTNFNLEEDICVTFTDLGNGNSTNTFFGPSFIVYSRAAPYASFDLYLESPVGSKVYTYDTAGLLAKHGLNEDGSLPAYTGDDPAGEFEHSLKDRAVSNELLEKGVYPDLRIDAILSNDDLNPEGGTRSENAFESTNYKNMLFSGTIETIKAGADSGDIVEYAIDIKAKNLQTNREIFIKGNVSAIRP